MAALSLYFRLLLGQIRLTVSCVLSDITAVSCDQVDLGSDAVGEEVLGSSVYLPY
jgi:hypothetical protein